MRGSIINRPKGSDRWSIILEAKDPQTGRRKRRWHAFKGTSRQAETECARLVTELESGAALEPSKTTVGQYLERWLKHIKTQVSPKSYERYAGIVNQNLVTAIGAVRLPKLKPAQISEAYSAALVTGRRDGAGGLSPRTVGHMHRVLKQALGDAVRWGDLSRNPCDAVDPPKVDWKAMRTYDLPQTVELIDAVRDSAILVPVVLGVLCGLRRGEICALRWKYVDFAAGQLSVVESLEQTKSGLRFKSLKSGKGRTVALSATVIDELRAHRLKRVQDLLRLGVGLSDDDLVIGHADGTIVSPIYISQLWARTIKKTRLPRLRFHDLRHAHATHLLANGVHPKVASERLGHSKVGITLDLYSHVIPGMQEDAAALVDQALAAARRDKGRKS